MKRFIGILVLAIVLSGCNGEEECLECDTAITHMADKIQNYSCNPNFMENAWRDIPEKCGYNMGDKYVGYMAETCSLWGKKVPYCNGPLNTSSFSDVFYIKLLFEDGPPNAVLYVEIEQEGYDVDSKEVALNEEWKVFSNVQNPFAQGNSVKVILRDNVTDVKLHSENKRFTFDRIDNWHTVREVLIKHDTTGYFLEFVNWE